MLVQHLFALFFKVTTRIIHQIYPFLQIFICFLELFVLSALIFNRLDQLHLHLGGRGQVANTAVIVLIILPILILIVIEALRILVVTAV